MPDGRADGAILRADADEKLFRRFQHVHRRDHYRLAPQRFTEERRI
jgi:hypothetical protein